MIEDIKIVDDKIIKEDPISDKLESRMITVEADGNKLKIICDVKISAEDYVANNQEEIIERYKSIFSETHNKQQIAPDFIIQSPPKPKTKEEAKEKLKAILDSKEGEMKSLGTAVQCLVKLLEDEIGW